MKGTVQTAPDDLKVHQALFMYYLAHKFYDKARTVLDELVWRKPEEVQARIMLVTFHAGRNENSLAEESFLKAVELAPDNPLFHMLIARFYNANGQFDKAESFIKQALAIHPDHAGLKTVYTDFYFRHKAYKKVEETVNEVLALRPSLLQ